MNISVNTDGDLFGTEIPATKKLFRPLGPTGFVRAAKVRMEPPPPAKFGPRRTKSVDSFAGGGGASNGIQLAFETLEAMGLLPVGHRLDVDFAVNHDEPALAMHAINHRDTVHLPHNVWKVSMRELLGDDFFGLLWLSPDCRDHSPAKGGPITSRSVRDLAWVLIRWLKELPDWQRPRAIFLENVPAFSKWSPLVDHPDGGFKRDETRLGEVFHRFVHAIAAFGYSVGWKELVACEFGDPTIRRRLHMVMRRDGKRVKWPKPTHAAPKSDAVKAGKLLPWPVAADIIDFDRPTPSIFLTKAEAKEYTKATGVRIIRPLAVKTDARIAKGVKRHVLEAAEAFIVTCNHGGEGFRGQGLREPFQTVTRARDAHGIVVPHLSAYYGKGAGGTDRSASVDQPITTVPTAPRHALIAPHVVSFRGDQVGRAITDALGTVTANSFIKRPGGASPIGLAATEVAPFVSLGQHGGSSRAAGVPLHTVAASTKDQNQVVAAEVAPFVVQNNNDRKPDGSEYFRAGRSAEDALSAVTANPTQSLAAVYVAQHNGGPRAPVGRDIDVPLSTTMQAGSQQQLVAATFIKQDFGNSVGQAMDAPTNAVTAGGSGKMQLMAANMLSLKGSDRRDGSCADAHPAVCASGQHSAVVTLPLMTAYYSTGGQSATVADPMLAVPTKARFGLTEADAAPPPLSEQQCDRARQVADFMRRHGCWDGGEFVTLSIKGEAYIIIDIGMRMLTPRELARAQGFPDSYILAAPYKGGTLSETEQRHKIGNSVCRRPAAAVIVENYRPPLEWGFVDQPFREAAE